MKQSLDTLTTKLPHFLLQQGAVNAVKLGITRVSQHLFLDILEYYLQSEVLNSPSEFLQRYTKPTHITLDSGTWVGRGRGQAYSVLHKCLNPRNNVILFL